MDEEGEMDVEASGSKHVSSLLHIAVLRLDQSSVRELIDKRGYNVNLRDSDKNTPLHIAAECESSEILNMLLQKGALVNVANNLGEFPMHKAATSTNYEMIKSLLKSGGSVNVSNNKGYTPFHIAVTKGYKKVIELMLNWGASVHYRTDKKQTPLHIATTHCNCILAEILLDRGADIDARDNKGQTPLHLAVGRVDITMTELFLERGADINVPDFEGQTPLHLAANHWNYKIVKMLLDRGTLINSQNNKGETALHIAVKNGDLTLVNRLLDRGALTDTFDCQGLTPLQYACANGYFRLMLKLISKGADVGVFPADPYSCRHSSGSNPAFIQVHINKIQWSQPDELHSVKKNEDNSELRNLCLQELEKIKTKRVQDMSGNEYSLINVLDKNRHLDFATCKLFEVVLDSPKIDTEFPLYAFILKVSLLRMKKRHVFIRAAQFFFVVHNFFCESVKNQFPTLPHKVIGNIFRRLSYIDLQNLIVVTENTLRIKNRHTIVVFKTHGFN